MDSFPSFFLYLYRKDDSESEEDYSPSDRSDQSDYDDYDERGLFAEVKKYGSDLTMGEDDKKWLDSLPELKREEILAERSENVIHSYYLLNRFNSFC